MFGGFHSMGEGMKKKGKEGERGDGRVIYATEALIGSVVIASS
jgi:hypothetical protein